MRDDTIQPVGRDSVEPTNSVTDFPSREFDAAVAQETQERDFVFLGVNDNICGIPVVAMTLAQALTLISLGSPFLCGGKAEQEHIAQFLWFLSPDFDPAIRARPFSIWRKILRFILPPSSFLLRINPRQRSMLRVALIPEAILSLGISEYIDQVFIEAPGRDESEPDEQKDEEGTPAALTSFASSYIDRFAAEYGWSKEQTLATSLAQLFALMRNMEIRHAAYFGKKAPLINYRSDKVLAEHMERRNAPALKAARAAQFAPFFARISQ